MKQTLIQFIEENESGFHSEVFTEMLDGKQIAVHLIKIPKEARYAYQQGLSASYFQRRQMEQFREPPYPKHSFTSRGSFGCFVEELKRDVEVRRQTNENFRKRGIDFQMDCLYKESERYVHNSIWDFYDAIGYDRKKKEFKKQ